MNARSSGPPPAASRHRHDHQAEPCGTVSIAGHATRATAAVVLTGAAAALTAAVAAAVADANCWGAPFTGAGGYDPPAVDPVDVAFVGNFGCEIDGAGALSCWGVGPTAPSLGASCNAAPKPKFPW